MAFIGTDRYSLAFLYPRFNPFPSIRYQMEVVDNCLQATSKWLTAQRCKRVAATLFLAFGSAMAFTAFAASLAIPLTCAGIAAGVAAVALSLFGKRMEKLELRSWALATPLESLVPSYGWANLKDLLSQEELSSKFESETHKLTLEELVKTFGYSPIDEGIAERSSWHFRLKKENPHISFKELIERYQWKVFDYELASLREWSSRAEAELTSLSLSEWISELGPELFSSSLLPKSFISDKIKRSLTPLSVPALGESLWPGLIACQAFFSQDEYEQIKGICLDYFKAKTAFALSTQGVDDGSKAQKEAAAKFAGELAKLSQRWRPIQAGIRKW